MSDKPKDFEAYSIGLVAASVCTSLPVEDAALRLNQEHPTGINSQWHLSEDKFFSDGETPNGAPCPDHPKTHKHYLFNC
jgi:hypothetical protein